MQMKTTSSSLSNKRSGIPDPNEYVHARDILAKRGDRRAISTLPAWLCLVIANREMIRYLKAPLGKLEDENERVARLREQELFVRAHRGEPMFCAARGYRPCRPRCPLFEPRSRACKEFQNAFAKSPND